MEVVRTQTYFSQLPILSICRWPHPKLLSITLFRIFNIELFILKSMFLQLGTLNASFEEMSLN